MTKSILSLNTVIRGKIYEVENRGLLHFEIQKVPKTGNQNQSDQAYLVEEPVKLLVDIDGNLSIPKYPHPP